MTDPYKYLAWIKDGYWNGHHLLPVSQIRTMLGTLAWKHQVFASIQSYDANARVTHCPLYFDLDGPPDQVLEETRHLVKTFEYNLGATPRIYYSGHKGFHLVADYQLEGPHCHLLAKQFARDIADLTTIDWRVYRAQSMFRIPGSLGSRGDRYKILLSPGELDLPWDDIREIAKTQRFLPDYHDSSKLDQAELQLWLTTAKAQLPRPSRLDALAYAVDSLDLEITPCLTHMLENPAAEGFRNETVFVLTRFFKICGLTQEDALKTFLRYPHWQTYDKTGDVTKVVRSVYNSARQSVLGCKGNSSSAELMRTFCENTCHFHTETITLNIDKDR
jgi:hypothetical protein